MKSNVICFFTWLTLLTATISTAAEPLHKQIDALMDAQQVLPVADIAPDTSFARRVYLKLTGTIPTSKQLNAFLADKTADRRTKLVESLLQSEAFVRHMVDVYDVMLMERRADKHIKAPEWRGYLEASFRANKPLNQLASEILGSDGSVAATRGAAKFILDRDSEVNLVTRDVGRMFFGVDLQCAQCHDHPLVDSYYQADYYGIYAYLSRNYIFTWKDKKAYLAEKTDGNVAYVSVFTNEGGTIGPRLPGTPESIEPVIFKGDDYKVQPAKNVRPIPTYSRRNQLAQAVLSGKNTAFNRNVTNRVWAMLIGRGFVEPVDMHHDNSPVAFPKVLDLLASRFPEMKYDMRKLIVEITKTKAFQRSYDMPADFAVKVDALAKRLASLKAQQSKLEAAALAAFEAAGTESENLAKLRKTSIEKRVVFNTALEAEGKAWKPFNDANKAAVASKSAFESKQKHHKLVANLATAAAVAPLAGDKDLKAIADQFKAKAAKLAADVKKAEADKTAKAKAAAAKRPPVDKARAAVTKSNAELKASLEAKQKQFAKHSSLRDKSMALLRDSKFLAEQIAMIEKLIAFRKAETTFATTHAKLDQQSALLKANEAKMAPQKAQLAQAKAKFAQLEKQLAAVTMNVKDGEAKRKQLQEILVKTKQLLAAINDAKSKLGDPAIGSVAGGIAKSDQAYRQQLTNTESQLVKSLSQRDAMLEKLKSAGELVKQQEAMRVKLEQQVTELKKSVGTLAATLPKLTEEIDAAGQKADAASADGFAVSQLSPLSPEELAWAMMTATGYTERQRASSAAEINKKKPLTDTQKKDPKAVVARDKEIDKAAYAKLRGNVGNFVKLFGAGAGQPQTDFFATADQALFLANGSVVLGWLSPSGDNLTARLNKEADPQKMAVELYRSVLTRDPSAEEIKELSDLLSKRPKEKVKAIQDIAWALLTSAEFRFHH